MELRKLFQLLSNCNVWDTWIVLQSKLSKSQKELWSKILLFNCYTFSIIRGVIIGFCSTELYYRCSREFVEIEMQNVLETNKCYTPKKQQYVVHYLRCSMMLESVPLTKATKLCPDLPILVIAYSDGLVKARCCVPEVTGLLNC